MPGQHEPSAGETTSTVAVRRAVPVPAPREDPGADLGPRTPDTTPTPSAPSAPAPDPSPEPGSPQAQTQTQAQATADGPESDAGAGVLFAGGDDGADDTHADPAAPGRPRGPMLAAAAIAGVVLISVPFLVLGLSDDDHREVSTAPVGGMTLDPGTTEDDPAAVYAAESPSPPASPSGATSPSPSRSPASGADGSVTGEKAASRAVAGRTAPGKAVEKAKQTTQPKAGTKAKEKTKKAAGPSSRQLLNDLSNQAGVLFKSVVTGKCADVPDFGRGKATGPVNQFDCRPTTADNQRWNMKVVDSDGGPGGASLFVIENRKDGLCMDVPWYDTVASGTSVAEYYCDGSVADNQRWYLESRSGGYWIRHAEDNLCLGVRGGRSARNDARLEVATCGGTQTTAQRWKTVSAV